MLQRIYAVLQNSFFSAIVLLAILLLTLVVAVSAVIYLPISIGEEPPNLYIDEMYYFPSLSLPSFNHLDIEYTDGGFLIPAYTRNGAVKGFAIIGDANYRFNFDDVSYEKAGNLVHFYKPASEEQLALFLLNANFTEITSRNQIVGSANEMIAFDEGEEYLNEIRYQAQSLIAKESDMYVSIRLFGYKRVYLPESAIAMALLITDTDEHYVYSENRTVKLSNYFTKEELYESIQSGVRADYPPNNLLIFAAITMSLLLIASIIVVLLLTIDIDEKKRTAKLVKLIEYPHWLIFLTVSLYFISQFLLMPYGIYDHWRPVITFFLYLLILLVFCKNKYELEYIGLNFNHWGHTISSAILLGFFFQMLGSFNIPTSFAIHSFTDFIVMFLVAFFLHALLNEIVFRGIIQNYIERMSNTMIAIIATAGIVVAVNLIANLYVHKLAVIEVLIQSFLIAPFGSIVLSLLYARTRSILASALLATLLIILPRILVF